MKNYDVFPGEKRSSGRSPSPRSVSYVKYLSEGMSKRKAALKAGYSVSVANTAKQSIEGNSNVQEMMEEVGLTKKALVESLRDGLEATKRYPGGHIHPDFSIRHRYLTTVLKILGLLKEKSDSSYSTQINKVSPEVEQLNKDFVDFLQWRLGRHSTLEERR